MNFIRTYLHRLRLNIKAGVKLYFILFIGLVVYVYTEIAYPLFISNAFIKLLIGFFFLSYMIQVGLLKKRSYFLYLVRTVLIVLIIAEYSVIKFTTIHGLTAKVILKTGCVIPDKFIGYKFKPGIVNDREVELLPNGDTIYNVYYSSDELGRRIGENKNDNGSKHAVFLGCSITFGEGLNFESTFPYLFKIENPGYAIYNYGFRGFGPHQFPFFFPGYMNTLNKDCIKNDSGFCLYTFIEDHYDRVFGGSAYLGWGYATPDVFIKNNELVYTKRSWLIYRISEILNSSSLIKYLNIQITYPKTVSFYKRFADIINYTANQYYLLKPKGKFIVGIYPSLSQDTSFLKYLVPGILVFKPSPPIDISTNRNKYELNVIYNSHPTGYLNLYYIKQFMEFMRSNNLK